MCRDIFEVHYLCLHSNCWEIPSQDPDCNGIRHRLTVNGIKACLHCWLQQGNRKKLWKTEGFAPNGRRLRRKECVSSVIYPIQGVKLKRESPCPTWKRHYPWQNRAWALRSFNLQAGAKGFLRHVNALDYRLLHPLYETDEDTPECDLYRLIEPEDLPRDENGEVVASHQVCPICLSSLVSDNPADNPNTHSGGLRQIPCLKKHVFCIGCIQEYVKRKADEQSEIVEEGGFESNELPYVQCLICYTSWSVKVHQKRTMFSRTTRMLEDYQRKMFENEINLSEDPDYVSDGSTFQFVTASLLYFLTWPTFHTVHRSMSVWPRSMHNGGRLPLGQLIAVGVAGTILQVAWLTLGPVVVVGYFGYRFLEESTKDSYKNFKDLVAMFWASSYGRTAWEQHLWLSEITQALLPNIEEGLRLEWEAQMAFWGPIFRGRG